MQDLPPVNLEDAPIRERERGWGPFQYPRLWLALLGAAAMVLAFPHYSIAGLAWVAPAFLAVAGLGADPDKRFATGWWAGFLFYLFSLDWLLHIPFPSGAIAGWLALSVYCALYIAVWSWAIWEAFPGKKALRLRALTFDESPRAYLETYLASSWFSRQFWALFAAALWVGLEYVRGIALTGFPWNFLGVSQIQMPLITQIAALGGPSAVSFLIVFVSLTLLSSVLSILKSPAKPWVWLSEISLSSLLTLGAVAYGWDRIPNAEPGPETPRTRIALVQPSVPQTMVWDNDPEVEKARLSNINALTRIALSKEPDLILWPEASIPVPTREQFETLVEPLVERRMPMLFGLESFEGNGTDDRQVFNSVWSLKPDGTFDPIYNKRRLVPFGEAIPLEDTVPLMKKLTPIPASYDFGSEPSYYSIAPHNLEATFFICFEDAIANLARESVRETTDVLINLTNDGWFGESSQQWQHAYNAGFRALETGRPLVRVANNGLSCWIDPYGRVRNIDYDPATKSIYAPGVKVFDLPSSRPETTPYLAGGHLFAPYAGAAAGAWLLICWIFIRAPRSEVYDG